MSKHQMLTDILTTAVEGGIGYWAQAANYRWSERYELSDRGVDLSPAEDEDDFNDRRVTLDDIEEAMRKIANGETKTPWVEGSECAETRALCVTLLRDPDNEDATSEMDAGHAERIMQVAVLGDVEFG